MDAVIAARSAGLDGVMTTEELVDAGLSREAIRKRVARGSLHRLYPGVYAVGNPLLSLRGKWHAAVRACGPGAVLSHRDAAMLLGLLRSSRRLIDVTVASQRGRRLDGIDHHQAVLLPRDRWEHEGIPCTSASRTVLDLAAVAVAPRPLERAYEQGWILGLLDIRALEDVLARAPRHRGVRAVRALMDASHGGRTVTRSDLEELFLSLVDRAGIPRPELNVDIPVPGEETSTVRRRRSPRSSSSCALRQPLRSGDRPPSRAGAQPGELGRGVAGSIEECGRDARPRLAATPGRRARALPRA